jgi:2-polyprenyl-3-methyl-5-hydroxy-6-metoxy-1,4-benzoquinol methylase
MHSTNFHSTAEIPMVLTFPGGRSTEITLVDGSHLDDLYALQIQQEPAFAKQIAASKKGSPERTAIVRQAYESICRILDEIAQRKVDGDSLSMGMDRRYTQFVLDLLAQQSRCGLDGGVFELGFGSGILLAAAAEQGYRVGGLEVAGQLFREAKAKLPHPYHKNLWLGDFQSMEIETHRESYSLAYWNDVFEHIPVDEISDYLERLYQLLMPGGKLVTITPNWHMRPSDCTDMYMPPRTEAVGFHLKEYTLGQVNSLLHAAGFAKVQSPIFISRNQIFLSDAFDITSLKVRTESLLEMLPFRWAVQICRRFGFNCTVATKAIDS